jgi:hypothetical protein
MSKRGTSLQHLAVSGTDPDFLIGRRRNLSNTTMACFVGLSAAGSLAYALNLFFIIMLYTPSVVHSEDNPRQDTLFTPKPAVLYLPVIATLMILYRLPSFLVEGADLTLLKIGYITTPLFLTFAPQVSVQESLGQIKG